MTPKIKKRLTIALVVLASVVSLALAAIAVVINFVFTPAKLTPIVLRAANESLNADLHIKSVELTFFSTFPQFGLRVEEGTLVSKVLANSAFSRQDSLLSFGECVITVSPLAYLTDNKILIHNMQLKDASVYAYKSKEGRSNWDIVKASSDTAQVAPADTASFNSAIDIRNIELIRANLTFDDRDTRVYARMDSIHLKLKVSLNKERSSLKLAFDNKNILFWQQGELLVNHVATSIKTDIAVDHAQRKWTFHDTELSVNGIKFDAEGTVVRDTLAQTLDMDVRYGLHAPSMETVLGMIPQSIVKKAKVSAKGEVMVEGTLKGVYGKQQFPVAKLAIQVKDASAKYADLPYGIDKLTANFEACVDLMRSTPSYLNLKIFHFKGAHTDVLADGRVDDLLSDPRISFHTRSLVDLNALAQTFPLQEGVSIKGKLDADLTLNCKLSSLRNQDIGRIRMLGKLQLNDFAIRDEQKSFDFESSASFTFSGDKTLQAEAEIRRLMLKSRVLSSTIERLSAKVTSTNPQDTTRVVSMQCSLNLSKLKAGMGDSLVLYSGKTTATVSLQPGKLNPVKPLVGLKFRTDSLYARIRQTQMGMNRGDFDVHAEKLRDSVWNTTGDIGFDKLYFKTPEFTLPVIVKDTRVALGNKTISLNGAQVQIGRSDLTARGSIYNLAGAMMRNETLRAKLDIESNLIDCTQLVNSIALPVDSLSTPIDTVSSSPSDMKLFVVPQNINFELQTNIRKVTFDKMLFEQVHGAVDIKDQYIYLKDLSMIALGAQMKTVAVYKASSLKRAYTGFDFRIKGINIGNLVEFIPALDSIVPMLRSFKGTVNFDIAAETRLNSTLNVLIPTLRSAIHLKGDSLVLMDGETFAEMSKMLMFKNKKENLVDSISVNITVDDGKVNIYPFLIEIDRYKAAVGGKQGLDMSFDYHVSILKSPLPFKAGINISGTPDKVKFKIGKAKYKDAVTPVNIHKIDSTRLTMEGKIKHRFQRVTH